MKSLSFVFQGNVLEENKINFKIIQNITQVRDVYPESEIILSTWRLGAENYRELVNYLANKNIVIILNDDPGAIYFTEQGNIWSSNINRMIVSSVNGIKYSTRDYVVKLRVDSYFYNRNLGRLLAIKNSLEQRYQRREEYSLFSERIINCNLFARDSRSYRPYLFHPGDIMLLGRRSDLLELFDLPLADDKIFKVINHSSLFSLMKYVPEQYLWVMYIKKKIGGYIYLGNDYHNNKLKDLSDNYYFNNFIPFNCHQLGFVWYKHQVIYGGKGEDTVYQFTDWRNRHSGVSDKQCYPNRVKYLKKKLLIKYKKIIYSLVYLILRISFVRRLAMKLNRRR